MPLTTKVRWKMWLFLLVLLEAQVISGISSKCDKTPIGQQPLRNPGDGGFAVSVAGSPNVYRPGQTYTVTLNGFRLQNGDIQPSKVKLQDFILVAESELPATENPDLGVFHLMPGDAMSKFSLQCSHAVRATSAVPKDEIQVLWTAPEAGTGCIQLKAMVVERPDMWFMDDGGLTYIFCEDNSPMETVPVVNPCCACDEAKYEVIFEGLWSRHTHPKDYPSNEWSTEFSDLIGASHSLNYNLWKYGEVSSPPMETLAESGHTKKLEIEMKKSSKNIRSVIKARGLEQRSNVISRTFAVFRMDPDNHLLSLVSKMVPSPDWIVGVSMEDLCLANCSWVDSRVLDLYPWDAGVRSGLSYKNAGPRTMPQEHIHRITACNPESEESPFYDPTCAPLKPVARVHIMKQREYKKQCPNGQGGQGIPLNPSWGNSVAGEIDPAQGNIYSGTGIGPSGNDDNDDRYGGQTYNDFGSSYTAYSSYSSGSNDRCKTSSWASWTSCSQTCGTGSQSRTRQFVNEVGASIAGCSKDLLFQKQTCENSVQCPSKYYDPLYAEEEVGLAGYSSPWSRRGLSAANLKKEETPKGNRKSYVYSGADKTTGQGAASSYTYGSDNGQAAPGAAGGQFSWFNPYSEKYAAYAKQDGFPPTSNKPGASNYNPYKAVGYYGYTYGGPPSGLYSNGAQNNAYMNYAGSGTQEINQIQGDSTTTNCDTEEWGQWSQCSNACGVGQRSRKRVYISSNTGFCTEDLFQSEDCEENFGCVTPASLPKPQRRTRQRKRKGPYKKEDPQCAVAEWTDWSPCSVSCGQGYKIRTRVFTLSFVPNRVCEGVRLTEKQDCRSESCPWSSYYGYDQPSYSKGLPRDMNVDMMTDEEDRTEALTPKEPYCSELPDPGVCKSEFKRWYYSPDEETCKEYTYSGCGGNRNSFMSYENCIDTCHSPSSKSSFNDLLPMALVRNDFVADDPDITPVDCKVSEWSTWSDCNVSCGRGRRVATREILARPQNGGQVCPRKLEKRRKCRGSCLPDSMTTPDWYQGEY